jgi:hypothetical protein
MMAILNALRWDIVLQARNGFYWASAFLVVMIGALLMNVPDTVSANAAVWVPAILAVNLQITTFFFVAGLMLLEREEGTLSALAVSPLSASGYLAMRTFSLTGLAAGRWSRARARVRRPRIPFENSATSLSASCVSPTRSRTTLGSSVAPPCNPAKSRRFSRAVSFR